MCFLSDLFSGTGQRLPWGTEVFLLLHCYRPNSASRKDAGILDLMGCNALRTFISNNYCIISGCNKTSYTLDGPPSSCHTCQLQVPVWTRRIPLLCMCRKLNISEGIAWKPGRGFTLS